MSEQHLPHFDHNEVKLPNQPFDSWLNSHTALVISKVFSFVGIIAFIASTFYYVFYGVKNTGFITLPRIQFSIYIAHWIILPVFIYWLIYIFDKNKKGNYRVSLTYTRVFGETLSPDQLKNSRIVSKRRLRKFKLYFLRFWIAMFLLYVLFTLSSFFPTIKIETFSNSKVEVLTDLKNKLNSKEETFTESKKENESDKNTISNEINKSQENPKIGIITEIKSKNELSENAKKILDDEIKKLTKTNYSKSGEALLSLLFPFLIFALNNAGLFFIYCCFTVMYSSLRNRESREKQISHINTFLFSVVVFTLSFILILPFAYNSEFGYDKSKILAYITLFDGISGILNAITLALLIARLDSKLIGLPSHLVSILYFYSAIQALFTVFEQPSETFQIIKTFVLIAVFISKVYFFFIITYTLHTGRMLNYLFCFPTLNDRVDSIFKNQFQIEFNHEKKDFHFVIKKKNSIIYRSNPAYKTKMNHEEKIEELRKFMGRKESYKINEKGGTFLVEFFEDKRLICKSISLSSRDEALDLIVESTEFIPYCKTVL